jgi:hypothetical protein
LATICGRDAGVKNAGGPWFLCGAFTSNLRWFRVGAKNWKLMAAAVAVAAIVIAGAIAVLGGSKETGDAPVAHVDTQLNALIGGYEKRFPWSSEMVETLKDQGLLTTPQRVYQLWTHFQMPCVNGKDMIAGKPELTKSNLAQQFNIDVSMQQAQHLNDVQARMCAAMPPGGWSAPT